MAMSNNPSNLSILYFIEGAVPTKHEALAIEELDFPVKPRNALHCEGQNPELCDGVLGAVPPEYSMYPNGHKAIADNKKARKEALKARSDEVTLFETAEAEQALEQGRAIERQRLADEQARKTHNKSTRGDHAPWDPSKG